MDRRQFLAGSSAAVAALAIRPTLAFAQAGDAHLDAVMTRIFDGDMRLSPQSMTMLGLDTGQYAPSRSKLDSIGRVADEAAATHARTMLAELKSVDPASLSEIGAVRRNVVLDMLEQRLVSEPFGIGFVGSPYRITQQDGAYFSVPDFLDSTHPVENGADAEAYLARLSAFPSTLDDQGEAQRHDAARGYLAPVWAVDLAMTQIGAQISKAPGENNMVRSLVSRAAEKGVAGDWQARATRIVQEEVYPALKRQLDLLGKLKPKARAGDGVWRVPRGDEIYSAALRYYTTTNYSPDEVHQIGLEQVAELSSELDTVLKNAGLTKGSVGERLTALSKQADQLYPNDDPGRAALIDSLNKGVAAMQAKLPQAFATIPTQPLIIRRVPVEIQDGAPDGYYSPASLDGSRPAIYWINLKDTADWPKYSLPALTYHEGVPGHHLHLSLMQEAKDLPLLLKNYFLSAYGEGWALYAEQVADELGGYQGLEKAGALQSWLFRAARLVVDTGLHSKRWTVEKAADYMVTVTGNPAGSSLREARRYCGWPGQACSYKIGQNIWRNLRSRAEQALGGRFDLRQFHEILNEGVMPLVMLEQRIDAWIARSKAAA